MVQATQKKVKARERRVGCFVSVDNGEHLYYVNLRDVPEMEKVSYDDLAKVVQVGEAFHWPTVHVTLPLSSEHVEIFSSIA